MYVVSTERNSGNTNIFSAHDGAKIAAIELPKNAITPMSVTAVDKHTLDRVWSSDCSAGKQYSHR